MALLIQDKKRVSVFGQDVSGKRPVQPAPENRLFPVFLKAEHLRLLIVGGGNVALEKLHAVLANAPEAVIRVVATHISDVLRQKALFYANVILEEHRFSNADLQDTDWVIIAVNDKTTSRYIRTRAKKFNLLVNVADTPALCDFYLGAVVQKGNLKIGISTNGKSPTLAKRLRELFQQVFPDEFEETLQNIHEIRNNLKGDFAAKVKKLNSLTRVLIDPASLKPAGPEKHRILYYCTLAWLCIIVVQVLIIFLPSGKIMQFVSQLWHDFLFPG